MNLQILEVGNQSLLVGDLSEGIGMRDVLLRNRCNGRIGGNLRIFAFGKVVVLEDEGVQGLVIESFLFLLVDLPKVTLQRFSRFDLLSGRRRIELALFYAGEGGKSSSSENSSGPISSLIVSVEPSSGSKSSR